MATKWKSSKLRAVIKFTAFVLAVLIAGFTGVFVTDKIDNTKGDDIAYLSYLEDAFFLDSQTDVYQTDVATKKIDNFTHELSNLISAYADGSKESYKGIKKAYDGEYLSFKNNLVSNISYFVNTGNDYGNFLRQMTLEIVSIEKIAAPDFPIITRTDYEYDSVLSYDYAHFWESNYPDYSGVFSTELKKKAEKAGADAILVIEDLTFSGNNYSGYYALKVNDEVFQYYLCEKYNYITKVAGTYEEFVEEYKLAKEALEEKYKGVKYIVASQNSVVTNVKKLATDWKSSIYKTMGDYDYYLVKKESAFYEDGSGRTRWFENINFFDSYSKGYEFVTHAADYEQSEQTTYVVTTAPVPTDEYGNYYETTTLENVAQFVATTAPYGDRVVTQAADVYIFFNETAMFDDLSIEDIRINYLRTREFLLETVVVIAILFAVFVLLCIILMLLSGNGKGTITFRDRVLIDVKLVINGVLLALCGGAMYELIEILVSRFNHAYVTHFALAALVCSAASVVVIDTLTFITRRIKGESFINGLFIVWLVRNVKGKINNFVYAKSVSRAVKVKTLALVLINVIVGVPAVLMIAAGYHLLDIGVLMFIGLFMFDIVALLLGLRFVGGVERMLKVIGEYRKGKLDEKVNINALPQYLVNHAQELHSLGEGLKLAVDEAVMQEKTKTELITNISHDLKTPLTSIINYVELLKDCGITDETAVSYLEVLGEKSDKLKNLITDLVEASKAATGNVAVEFVEVSLKEIINQLLGEFSQMFDDKGLNVVSQMPEIDVIVKADSKLLYRVLENLFVNIGKYALSGTRVYVTVRRDGNTAEVVLKNVSEASLNISPEELKQRFVRGDESRTTEGNGLGLSIAENLCLVQGAKLDIEISGDLFVAKVKFNLA